MVFSSPLFLFLFLPVVLAGYLIVPGLRVRNAWLLAFSLVFYAWGEPIFIALAVVSTLMNCALGIWVDYSQEPHRRKIVVALAIGLNIGLLAFFKYFNFAVDNLNALLSQFSLRPLAMPRILLPIGISFFTFHALSYIIDIYRRKWSAARNPADVALYIFFFPQMIAGPILRWSAIAPQLAQRQVALPMFAEGIRRFIMGLAKKILIANIVALPARDIFALSVGELSVPVAWLGVLCYSLQIYFDFSGYSDMAVGLGKMFGFEFIENFSFPYIAQSVRDFWRRWHISLSTWFRDYLYIPLGGSHCAPRRVCANLVIVFFLCGLWHGASWPFAIWGLYHGMFLVLERTRFGMLVDGMPRPLRHLYTLLVVAVGWVWFRADTLAHGVYFLRVMAGAGPENIVAQPASRYVTKLVLWALGLGVVFSAPLWPWIKKKYADFSAAVPQQMAASIHTIGLVLETALLLALLVLSASWLAGGTYNPFIYYRF